MPVLKAQMNSIEYCKDPYAVATGADALLIVTEWDANSVTGCAPNAPATAQVLLDYLAATDERTRGFVEGLVADDLDRVVDRRWDPPVTLGVRLVSVADDCLQHAGQAAYVRGLLGA